MLEQPGGERVTTAALAARLDVSEAALYRHFASKAQMFEGLIEFIEQTLFGLIARIIAETSSPATQVEAILNMLLNFAAKNPGMTRVLIGDALVTEDDRLQDRMNQLIDRIEASLKQAFRDAGQEAPEILLSGHHERIRRWRKKQALLQTLLKRPELFLEREFDPEEKKLLQEILFDRERDG